MKKIFPFLLLFIAVRSQAQLFMFNKKHVPTDVGNPILILHYGESNTGAQGGINSDATSGELAIHSTVKIVNPLHNYAFEDLHIGFNNLINHAWLTNNAVHSVELELANRMDAGTFVAAPVYLVKAGQGGSKITEWCPGCLFTATGVNPLDTLYTRTDSAIAQIARLTGKQPSIYIWFSQGINDIGAGMVGPIWKDSVKNHIARVRARYASQSATGKIPFLMTNFYQPGFNNFNASMETLTTEVSDVWVIDTQEQGTTPDGLHWTYVELKAIADKFMAVMLQNYL